MEFEGLHMSKGLIFLGEDALHYEAPTWTAENCTFEEGRPEKDEKITKSIVKNTRY